MTLAVTLKFIHVSCAFISIAGFALRGYWMLVDSALLQRRLTKVLPHIVDTLLLSSAILLLVTWRLSPLEVPWLSAKIIALLVYIALGMIALRFGKTRTQRGWAYLAALVTAGYMVTVAYTKSPLGFLQLVTL